jgi:hypothetical protein
VSTGLVSGKCKKEITFHLYIAKEEALIAFSKKQVSFVEFTSRLTNRKKFGQRKLHFSYEK